MRQNLFRISLAAVMLSLVFSMSCATSLFPSVLAAGDTYVEGNLYYYELPVIIINGISQPVGIEFISDAILEYTGNIARLLQRTNLADHNGLVSVCLLWRTATASEIDRFNAYLATLPADMPSWSLHVAALKSVAMVSGNPRATVYRLYRGTVYEVTDCRVSQTAYDNYMAGTIKIYNPAYDWKAIENKDCFVLVYFISEMPYDTTVNIPVIIDKVIK